ncbi:MAG TPA: short-chain dehydrogenase [Cyanobacteria bacterium UBA8156]|nr:short-chain dehydrogenase [Cyanobacteria bacterium UBA8156]
MDRSQALQGQTALVTGATRGIGRAVALALAERGVKVGAIARQPGHILAELTAAGTPGQFYNLDLARPDTVESQLANLLQTFGAPNIVVLNAGMALVANLTATSLQDWQRLFDLNVHSVFASLRAIVPAMRAQGGHIVFLGSIASKQAFPGWGAYCSSKFALLALAQTLAAEERPHIRVSTLLPGAVNTPLWETLPTAVQAQFDRTQMLSPEDVAASVIHVLKMPPHATVAEITLLPQTGVL